MFLIGILGRSTAFMLGFPPTNHLKGALKHAATANRATAFGRSLAASRADAGPAPMENIYAEWSVEDDRLLHERRDASAATLASLTGRGLQGVRRRLEKLRDVDSPAYARLFAGVERDTATEGSGDKLAPVLEVLRRIRWDATLAQRDFSVCYYDRVEDAVEEVPFDAENRSVSGSERMLVFAIPEHRITAVKYKERMVWDKEQKLDCVLGSARGKGETIDRVIEGYGRWKQKKDEEEELNRRRHAEVTARIKSMLGTERFAILKDMSSRLRHTEGSQPVKDYVRGALLLFRQAREETNATEEASPGTVATPDQSKHQLEGLNLLSELVAILPNVSLRERILVDIDSNIDRVEGRTTESSKLEGVLPELNEDDLQETFVRGSGAGGQKINKTSNRVILHHVPTGCRVECQDTRSLQQNRKIARRRLRLKLDEHINGDRSRTATKKVKAAHKKARGKARNRSRQRKKREAKAADAVQSDGS